MAWSLRVCYVCDWKVASHNQAKEFPCGRCGGKLSREVLV